MLEVQKTPQIDLADLARIWTIEIKNFKTLVSVSLNPATTNNIAVKFCSAIIPNDSPDIKKRYVKDVLRQDISNEGGNKPLKNPFHKVDKNQFVPAIVSEQEVGFSEEGIDYNNGLFSLAQKALVFQADLSRFYPELPGNFLETLQKSHHECLEQIAKTDPQACLTKIALNPAVMMAREIRNFILKRCEDPTQPVTLNDEEKSNIKNHITVNLFLTQIVALLPEISEELEKYQGLKWLSAVRELSYSTNASPNYESASSILDRMRDALYANYLPDGAENRNANKEGETTSDQGLQVWTTSRDSVIKDWSTALGADRNLTLLKLMRNLSNCPTISKEHESRALMTLSLRAISSISATGFNNFIDHSTIQLTPDKKDLLTIINRELRQAISIAVERFKQLAQDKNLKELAAAQHALAKSLREQAEEESKKTRFNSTFQSVPLELDVTKFISDYEKTPTTQDQKQPQKTFIETIDLLKTEVFDYRGDSRESLGDAEIKELANLVLAPQNLVLFAGALGVNTKKYMSSQLIPDRTPVLSYAEAISALYKSSSAAKQQIDEMLTDDGLCLPLATLVLPLGEVSQFIGSMSSAKRSSNQDAKPLFTEFIERIKGALSDFETIKCAKSKLDSSLRTILNQPSKKAEYEPAWLSSIRAQNEGIIIQWNDNGTCFIVGRFPNENISFISTKAALKDRDSFIKELEKQFHQRANEAAFYRGLEKIASSGIDVSIDDATKVARIRHEAAEIDYSLATTALGTIETILERFDHYQTKCRDLLDACEILGIKITKNGDSRTFSHKRTKLEIPKEIPVRRFGDIEKLITKATTDKLKAEKAALAKQTRAAELAPIKHQKATSYIIPSENSKIVIIDSGCLMTLAVPTSTDRNVDKPTGWDPKKSYLQAIRAMALTPNVRVYATMAVIGEMLGSFSWVDDSGTVSFAKVRTFSLAQSKAIEAIFEHSSYLRIRSTTSEADPQYIYKVGKEGYPTIVCMDSDKPLFDEMKASADNNLGSTAISEGAAIKYVGTGLGDKSITTLISALPVQSDILVVTTDGRYVRDAMPKNSGGGGTVGACGPFDFLECVLDYLPSKQLKAVGLGDAPSSYSAVDTLIRYAGDESNIKRKSTGRIKKGGMSCEELERIFK